MSPLAKQFSFVLFMLVSFTSYLHVEARNGKLFFVSLLPSHHKKSHERLTSLESPAPAPAPVAGGDIGFVPVPSSPEIVDGFAPAPAPSNGDIEFAPTPLEGGNGNGNGYAPVLAPAPEGSESDNPYGLYGKDGEGNEFPAKEFSNERLTEYNSVESYNNADNNNNINNGNGNNYGDSSTIYNNKNYGSTNNYNNNGYTNNYNNMGYSNSNYESEKQGMSDTRFLDNGKYYYDPNQGKYNQNHEYQSQSMRGSSNEGYYGEKSNYEFDSMDEYERQQGYSP